MNLHTEDIFRLFRDPHTVLHIQGDIPKLLTEYVDKNDADPYFEITFLEYYCTVVDHIIAQGSNRKMN